MGANELAHRSTAPPVSPFLAFEREETVENAVNEYNGWFVMHRLSLRNLQVAEKKSTKQNDFFVLELQFGSRNETTARLPGVARVNS